MANHRFPNLDEDAPEVPDGLRPRPGVEYGCGDPDCDRCYEPDDDVFCDGCGTRPGPRGCACDDYYED